MTEQEIQDLIRQELPKILQNQELRNFVLQSVTNYFAGKQETESRFDRILEQMERDNAESRRKWDESQQRFEQFQQRFEQFQQESERKWEASQQRFEQFQQESERKWNETRREWQESQQRFDHFDRTLDKFSETNRRYGSTISALGARWGLHSEESFRNGLRSILEDSFGVEVVNVTEYDDTGEVFGRPDQIELDLLIKNGGLIICEIKSSMSKPDMYIFEKKIQFYQKKHQRQADRKIVISPMVNPAAETVAKNLGIEVYTYAGDVKFRENSSESVIN